jgi:hypothetical protein
MDDRLARLLAIIPSGRVIEVKSLIAVLAELPGNRAARIEIDQQGQDWILTINLSDLSR